VERGWLHDLDLIGRPAAPTTWDGRPFRHVVLRRDLPVWNAYRRAGLASWRSLLRSYRPRVAFYDLDPRDPRVAWGTARRLIRQGLGSAYRAVFRRKPRRPG
jgi:hypothetical protein